MKMLKKAIRKIFRRKFIRNFNKFCRMKQGHALLYFKTDYYFMNGILEDRSHTNEWESYEIARILNELGFWVDIADRTISKEDVAKLEDKYDLFIGIGAGDSGRYFADIAKKLKKAVRVLYALGPEPNLSNKITTARHDLFRQRHQGAEIVVRRLIKQVDIDESMKYVDAIFTNCNDWGIEGYKKFGKPIYRVWLSSYPALSSKEKEINNKDQKKFLYFGGNGNITKGLDLAIEAFAKTPELELYIGAPKTEADFNAVMDPILAKSPNIHFIGFMDVKSKEFDKLAGECGYVVLPSSSEGCATSVTTCMRKALIPIVTEAAGVDTGDFGFMIESIDIDRLAEMMRKIAASPRDEFLRRSRKSYAESSKYTQENFSATFKKAVQDLISKKQ